MLPAGAIAASRSDRRLAPEIRHAGGDKVAPRGIGEDADRDRARLRLLARPTCDEDLFAVARHAVDMADDLARALRLRRRHQEKGCCRRDDGQKPPFARSPRHHAAQSLHFAEPERVWPKGASRVPSNVLQFCYASLTEHRAKIGDFVSAYPQERGRPRITMPLLMRCFTQSA